MQPITLNVLSISGGQYCLDVAPAEKIHRLIVKAFEAKKPVALSFRNVELSSVAFLNIAIGQLYRNFSEDFIRQNLSVHDLIPSDLVLLKRVVVQAKVFYKEPAAFPSSQSN